MRPINFCSKVQTDFNLGFIFNSNILKEHLKETFKHAS